MVASIITILGAGFQKVSARDNLTEININSNNIMAVIKMSTDD
jgi:hypothetical protein